MKKIEERSIEKYPFTAENMDKALKMRKLYVKIAAEQQKVDIDRFKTVMFNWGVQKGMSYQERQELMQYIDRKMEE